MLVLVLWIVFVCLSSCDEQVFNQFPAARAAVKDVQLVENSASMRRLQENKLQKFVCGDKCGLSWADSLEDVHPDKDVFTMIVAHEFFDALPFHLIEVWSYR